MQRILNKRERAFLYITVIIIIFSISFNFLIAPAIKKNDSLNKEISINRAKLNRYMRLLSQKGEIEEKYGKLASGMKLSADARASSVSVLSELEFLVKSANIRIIDLRPESSSGNSLVEISIDLRTEGTMEEYLKFIYDVRNSPLLLRIKRFQFNARPNSLLLEGIFSISQLSS